MALYGMKFYPELDYGVLAVCENTGDVMSFVIQARSTREAYGKAYRKFPKDEKWRIEDCLTYEDGNADFKNHFWPERFMKENRIPENIGPVF